MRKRLRTLLELAPDSFCLFDCSGSLLDADSMLESLTGRERHDLLGKTLRDMGVLDAGELEAVEELFRSAGSGEEVGPRVLTITRADGTELEVEIRAHSIGDEAGPAVIAMLRDISQSRRAEKSMRLMQYTMEHSYDAVFWVGSDARLHYANEAAGRLLGYSKEDFCTMTLFDIHPEMTGNAWTEYWEALRSAGSITREGQLKGADDRMVPMEMSGSFMMFEGEEYICIFARDVTLREKAAEALSEREARLRGIFRAAPTGIGIVSGRTIEEVNGHLCEMLGYTPDELTGKDARILYITDEEYERVGENRKLQVWKRGTGRLETRWKRKDGTPLDVLVTYSPIDPDEPNQNVIFIALDITERRRSEEVVLRSEALLCETQRMTRIGGWEYNAQNGEMEWTDEMYNIHRLPQGAGIDLLAATLEHYHPEDREKMKKAFKGAVGEGDRYDLEVRFMTADGEARWVRSTARPIEQGGRVVRVVGNLMDITRHKHTEIEMRQKLLRFDLQEGNLYLVKERALGESLGAFENLLEVGYSGTILSRTPPERFESRISIHHEVLWLSEKGDGATLRPDSDGVLTWVETLDRGHVLLFDRLDYLISQVGLKKALPLIHGLGEIAYIRDHIILLSLDPDILVEKDLRHIEKETLEMKALEAPKLPGDLSDIIHYIHKQNLAGVKPTYSAIGAEIDLSRPTVRKRVRDLIFRGYLTETVKGRKKVVEVTEKGRRPVRG